MAASFDVDKDPVARFQESFDELSLCLFCCKPSEEFYIKLVQTPAIL